MLKTCYHCNSLFTGEGSYCSKECLDKDLPFKLWIIL